MRGLAIITVAVAVLALVETSSAAGATRGVKSIGNPPGEAKAHFSVNVQSRSSTVRLYLSTDRRISRGDKRLRANGKLRKGKGKLKVTLPKGLKPNAYFLIACPGSSRKGCVASRAPLVVVPTGRIVLPSVGASPAGDRASTATIGAAGGSISATAPNGATFSLSIPAQSVPDGTQITLTPISSLTGPSKFGTLVAGVLVGPTGLQTMRGATLTITPATVPLKRLRALAFESSGAAVYQTPFLKRQQSIVLGLTGSGGYALTDTHGHAAASSRSFGRATVRQAGSGGGGVWPFYAGLISGLLDDLRNSGHDIGDGSSQAEQFAFAANSVLSDFYKDVMANEVPPGLKDDDAAMLASRELCTWAREMQLLGLAGHEAEDKVFRTILKLVDAAQKRAQQRCANNHNLKEIGDKILPWERQRQLLGAPEKSWDELFQCARFRVEIDSDVNDTPSAAPGYQSGSFHFHYNTQIENVKMVGDPAPDPLFMGNASGSYADASGTVTYYNICGSGPQGPLYRTDTVTVTGSNGNHNDVLRFSLPLSSASTAPYALLVHSGASENYHTTSEGDCTGPDTDTTDQIWWGDVQLNHEATGETSGDNVDFHLDPGAGDVVAQRTYSLSADDVSEETTVKVIHTPPPPPP